MVRCPKCGSSNTTHYKPKDEKGGYYCYKCRAYFGTGGAITGTIKGVSSKAPSPIATVLALIALLITFFLNLDAMTKLYIVGGFAAIVLIFWGLRWSFAALLLLCIYLGVTTILPVSAWTETPIIKQASTALTCSFPCYLGYAFSGGLTSGMNPNEYCDFQCNVVNRPKTGCTDCLSISQVPGTTHPMDGYTERVNIHLSLDSTANTDARNIYVRTISEQAIEFCLEGYAGDCSGSTTQCVQDKCTIGKECIIESGKGLDLSATFCNLICKNGHFKYNVSASYDYYTFTEKEFDLINVNEEPQIGSGNNKELSSSSSGPLNFNIGAYPRFIFGQEKPSITVYVSNTGRGTVKLKEIRILQDHSLGPELTLSSCTSGNILGNGVQENDYIVFRNFERDIRPGDDDQVTCDFDIPSGSMTAPFITYTFSGIANYSSIISVSADLTCSKQSTTG